MFQVKLSRLRIECFYYSYSCTIWLYQLYTSKKIRMRKQLINKIEDFEEFWSSGYGSFGIPSLQIVFFSLLFAYAKKFKFFKVYPMFVSPEGTEHFSLSSAGMAFLLNEYFISGLILTAPIAVEVILSDGFKHSEPKSITQPILASSVKFFNSQTQGIIAVLISTTWIFCIRKTPWKKSSQSTRRFSLILYLSFKSSADGIHVVGKFPFKLESSNRS